MDELEIIDPQKLEEGEASEETSEEKTEAKPEEKPSDSTEESPKEKPKEENKVDYDSLSVEELEHMIGSSIQSLRRKKLPFPAKKKPTDEPGEEKMSINEPMLEILSSVFELFRHKEEEPEPEPKPAKEMAKEFMKAIGEKDTKISQLSSKLKETEGKLEKLVKPTSKAVETLAEKSSKKGELVTFRDGAVGTWE